VGVLVARHETLQRRAQVVRRTFDSDDLVAGGGAANDVNLTGAFRERRGYRGEHLGGGGTLNSPGPDPDEERPRAGAPDLWSRRPGLDVERDEKAVGHDYLASAASMASRA